jgi:YD repeat-containing protein
LIEKSTDIETVKIEYDSMTNKISKIQTYNFESKQQNQASYKYDGNDLIQASNSNGESIILRYDANHRLIEIRNDRSRFLFDYNDWGQILGITKEGTDKIILEYDVNGEFKDYVSNNNMKRLKMLAIIYEVQSMFALLEPVGVKFNL